MTSIVSFLGSGPAYRVELPGVLAREAFETTTVLNDRTVGAFRHGESPITVDNPIFREIDHGENPDGVEYALFERTEWPYGWGIRWRVGGWEIGTEFGYEQGRDHVSDAIASLRWGVHETSGMPVAILGPGFRLTVSSDPEYQEEVAFLGEPGDHEGAILGASLRRPNLRPATSSRKPTTLVEAGENTLAIWSTPQHLDVGLLLRGPLTQSVRERIEELGQDLVPS